MNAQLIAKAKEVQNDGTIIEIVVWRAVKPIQPCWHPFKYRLYFGSRELCWVRYDNERGKGDHRHIGALQEPYFFESLGKLLTDFQHDVTTWRKVP